MPRVDGRAEAQAERSRRFIRGQLATAGLDGEALERAEDVIVMVVAVILRADRSSQGNLRRRKSPRKIKGMAR